MPPGTRSISGSLRKSAVPGGAAADARDSRRGAGGRRAVVPGQPVGVSVAASNNGAPDVAVKAVRFAGLDGEPAACAGGIAAGGVDVHSRPADWQGPPVHALLEAPDGCGALRLRARRAVRRAVPADAVPRDVRLSIGGADVTVERPVEYRYSDSSPGRSEWS